jgi:hypothetical protein
MEAQKRRRLLSWVAYALIVGTLNILALYRPHASVVMLQVIGACLVVYLLVLMVEEWRQRHRAP